MKYDSGVAARGRFVRKVDGEDEDADGGVEEEEEEDGGGRGGGLAITVRFCFRRFNTSAIPVALFPLDLDIDTPTVVGGGAGVGGGVGGAGGGGGGGIRDIQPHRTTPKTPENNRTREHSNKFIIIKIKNQLSSSPSQRSHDHMITTSQPGQPHVHTPLNLSIVESGQ